MHVVAEDVLQRRLQQVRGGVVVLRRAARRGVHVRIHGVADLQRAFGHARVVAGHLAHRRFRPLTMRAAVYAVEHAGVAHLSAGLRVERRLIEDDLAALVEIEAVDALAVFDDGRDARGARDSVVADELRLADFLMNDVVDGSKGRLATAGPRATRLLALAIHGGFEAFAIHGVAAIRRRCPWRGPAGSRRCRAA